MIQGLQNVWKQGWGSSAEQRSPWQRLPFAVGEGARDVLGTAYVELVVIRLLVVLVALAVLVAVTARARRRQAHFPNLMIWMGAGHRRERTELGVEGVYLDRRPLTPEELEPGSAVGIVAGAAIALYPFANLRLVRSCSAVPVQSTSLRPVPSPLYRNQFARKLQSAMSAPMIPPPALAAAAALREMVASPDAQPLTRLRVSRTM